VDHMVSPAAARGAEQQTGSSRYGAPRGKVPVDWSQSKLYLASVGSHQVREDELSLPVCMRAAT
jgi:hypothetical protein